MALGKTVAEIRQMSLEEMVGWQRFAAIHPFPAELLDMHGAQIASVIANVNRDPAKMPTPFQVTDFMILGQKRKTETPVDEADKFLKEFS